MIESETACRALEASGDELENRTLASLSSPNKDPHPHGGGFFVDKTGVFRSRERSKSRFPASGITRFGAVPPSLRTLMIVLKLIGTMLRQSLTGLFTDQ